MHIAWRSEREEMRQIELNPQEVLILTTQMLEGGWVKGALYKRGTIDYDGNTDPYAQGVCVVGALQRSIETVLRPQIELQLQEMPEFVALPVRLKTVAIRTMTQRLIHPLVQVFRERIAQVIGPGAIEGWNDSSERQKRDVVEAMKASLEIITAECMEVWSRSEVQEDLRQEYAMVERAERQQ
jgi:hypothetical protein